MKRTYACPVEPRGESARAVLAALYAWGEAIAPELDAGVGGAA